LEKLMKKPTSKSLNSWKTETSQTLETLGGPNNINLMRFKSLFYQSCSNLPSRSSKMLTRDFQESLQKILTFLQDLLDELVLT
jgi:ABC-type bacteriocin/lantibiotic exporter with double-glycine peptidase domain